MSSNDNNNKPTAANPPRGIIAAVCITAAIVATLLWTGLIYWLYQKRKQRLLKQHKRQNSLLDPTGAPRRMSTSTGNATTEKKTKKGGLHQRTASKVVTAMTPITVAPPTYQYGQNSRVESYAMTPTTYVHGSRFDSFAPSAYHSHAFMEPQELPTPTFDANPHAGGPFTVGPPPIPDEPIELMDKHYSQQFGKFKAVNWEAEGSNGEGKGSEPKGSD